MNVTLDDTSPQIRYVSKSWGWSTNHTSDGDLNRYFLSSFHGTYTDSDCMQLTFNGSAVYIYGARRPNHGVYSAQIDDGNVQYLVGDADPEEWQSYCSVPEACLLSVSIVCTPPGNATYQWWLDIDYIVVTAALPSYSVYTTVYDDTSSAFSYAGAGWQYLTNNLAGYYNRSESIASSASCVSIFGFNGSSVQLFGSIRETHGNYSVSLDGAATDVFNGTYYTLTYNASLYHANNLTVGPHKLQISNIPTANKSILAIDYAVVNSSRPLLASNGTITNTTIPPLNGTAGAGSTTSNGTAGSGSAGSSTGSGGSSGGSIAGGVVGGLAGAALIAFLLWLLLIRRRWRAFSSKRRYAGPIDLDGEPSDFGGSNYPLSPSTKMREIPMSREVSGSDSGAHEVRPAFAVPAARERDQTGQPFLEHVPPPPGSSRPSFAYNSKQASVYDDAFSSENSSPRLDDFALQPTTRRSTNATSRDQRLAISTDTEQRSAQSKHRSGASILKSAVVALPYTASRPGGTPALTPASTLGPTVLRSTPALIPHWMSVAGREQDAGPLGPRMRERNGEESSVEETLPPEYEG